MPDNQIAEITGTIKLMRSTDKRAERCICCEGPHVYSQRLVLPMVKGQSRPNQEDLNDWLRAVIDFKSNDGRRIKISAELID